MARRATSGRVEVRPTSLRIAFTLNGAVCRETLRIGGAIVQPTPANIKFARKLAETIQLEIRAGIFEYGNHFPESVRAVDGGTFASVADTWLAAKGQLKPATLDQYGTALRLWKRLVGDRKMDALTYQEMASIIGAYPWASAKSANNYLIALRGIFAFHYAGPRAGSNPMIGVDNLKVVKKKPDPLTAEERDLILRDLEKHYDPRVPSYFTFAFYTGMRPEEIIALQWGDIDHLRGIVRVERVRTFRGSERDGSKTDSVRDVDLVQPALQALKAMEPFTKMKSPYIFENPVTSRPWHDERSQRDHYWAPSLKRLGVRRRRAYCTRHTYATVALMAGVNAAYVAAQMGHSSTKMFFETYARWIDGADKGVQRAAMEAAFSPVSPQKVEDTGRRDWIRTNTPPSGG